MQGREEEQEKGEVQGEEVGGEEVEGEEAQVGAAVDSWGGEAAQGDRRLPSPPLLHHYRTCTDAPPLLHYTTTPPLQNIH